MAERFAETPCRDTGSVAKALVGAGGRGCNGGTVKGMADILLWSQESDSGIGSWSM